MTDTVRDGDFDEFLDAVAEDAMYHLECPNGHAILPPRTVCPQCSSPDLTEQPTPETGQIETYTRITVAPPRFTDDAPYTVAIASFGPVRVTGQLQNPELAVQAGTPVTASVASNETPSERVLIFEVSE